MRPVHSFSSFRHTSERKALSYSFTFRSRKEFEITDTELKLIAAAAITGLKSHPKTGYNIPSAIGTPRAL